MRQQRIKMLAAEADARWEAKPSLLDMPIRDEVKKVDQTTSQENKQEQWKDEIDKKEKGKESTQTEQTSPPQSKAPDDPWKQMTRGGPSETWQPKAWTPTSTPKR
jgi:NADH dehydrogenase [ubiquinone] 1 alpha subcomplex assembly factor 2